jgi:fluoroacetyl-CoA thioesterase
VRSIPQGYEARLEILVTDEMTVDFAELGRVHDVYSTYWMARHMEEAGRKIIVPFLDPDDDGVGSAVSVRHRAPVLPGMRLTVVARHRNTEGNRIVVDCTVHNELGELVGDGTTEQVVLPASEIQKRFEATRRRFKL